MSLDRQCHLYSCLRKIGTNQYYGECGLTNGTMFKLYLHWSTPTWFYIGIEHRGFFRFASPEGFAKPYSGDYLAEKLNLYPIDGEHLAQLFVILWDRFTKGEPMHFGAEGIIVDMIQDIL